MQVCTKCGKVNMLTRKYCMNCGASLLQYGKKQEKQRKYSVLSDSRIISRKPSTITPFAEDIRPSDSFEISTDDNFVKPSEIVKDRIRSLKVRSVAESELDKARHAFELADAVGIDETGTGVIETRMLRASEVRELLEDWGPITLEETESSEEVSHESTVSSDLQPAESSREEREQRFLGTHSTLTKQDYSETAEISAPESRIAAPSDEFSSTLYHTDESSVKPEIGTREEVGLDHGSSRGAMESKIPPESVDVSYESTPWVVVCPDCGKAMHSDLFEYPHEVYSHMGTARLKQAKFLFIQGNPEEALKAARLARLFFEKAKDERGLIQLARLERLLGPTD